MYKIIVSIIFISLYLLVTFFGLGPVVFADGTMTERIQTLLVVLLLYIIISVTFISLLKRKPK